MRTSFRKLDSGRAVAKFATVAAVFLLGVLAGQIRAELLPTITFTVADGLLRDNVYRIRQDSRGYFWFCSAEGLTRFDGTSFLNFTTDDGLPDRHVNDIVETANGRYFVATDAGIAELRPRGLRNSPDNPLFRRFAVTENNVRKVTVFLKRRNGDLLAGTERGLFKIDDEAEQPRVSEIVLVGPTVEGTAIDVSVLAEMSAGDLLVGTTAHGLFRLSDGGEISNIVKGTDLPSNTISAILETRDGALWVGTRPDFTSGGGLTIFRNGSKPKTYTKSDGFPGNWITNVFESKNGAMWLGTTGGLCAWQGESTAPVCKLYRKENGLCDTEVWAIDEDRDGNLWAGTRCGVIKRAHAGFTSFTEKDGLPSSFVNSLFEDDDGLYVSVNLPPRLITRFTGNAFDAVKPNFPRDVTDFGWGWKQTILKDSAGDWWFPTKNGLVLFSNTDVFRDLTTAAPKKIPVGDAGEVFRIFEDSRRDVWVATTIPNQLFRWERTANRWHDYSNDAGTGPNRVVTAFAEDRSGNLWITSGENDSALIRYRDGKFRIFGRSDGIPGGWTRDVHVDKTNRVWLATANDGLIRIDNPNDETLKLQKFTTADGLASNGSYCVTEDEFGRIYVGSGRGLDRVNPANGQVENFTTANGLPDSNVEVAFRDRRNQLWFSTPKGLARLIPEQARTRTPPVILINAVRVNGVARSVSILGEEKIDDMTLASDERQLEIDFVGLGPSPGEKLHYEYRLGDGEWTKTNERTLGLVNLPSGDYRFEIRAITNDRIYSLNAAALSFQIAAPIWLRWWFISLILFVTALVVYAGYRSRVRKLLELERTRTRIATDLHDDIGSNLSKISLLSEIVNLQFEQESNKPNAMLTSIAEISRESVSSMSDIVWAINPQRDSMPELIRRMRSYAEGIFVEKGIRVVFETNAETEHARVSMNIRRDIYLIFKEAVNNAAKHSGCDRLRVDFRIERAEIFLQIADNGAGFDSTRESEGNGLLNMESRATANGGVLTVESASGEGTKISVRLPVR